MLLKICDDNFLFMISQTKYLNVICLLIIILCIYLCIFIKNKIPSSDDADMFVVKSIISIVALFLLFGLFSVFLILANVERYNGCACSPPKSLIELSKSGKLEEIRNLTYNKIILVGDSRMEFIENSKMGKVDIPSNISFVAKSGADIDWLNNTGIPQFEKSIGEKKYIYHAVMNFGINDFYKNIDIDKRAEEYFDVYEKVAKKYPDVNFYVLSVNPIERSIMDNKYVYLKATNSKIEDFNNKLYSFVKDSSVKNISICDSYNELDFNTVDGLHYDKETNQEIIDYIVKECVDYK